VKHQNVSSRLIDNTIAVIATEGLEKTTTKAIVSGTDINEAYIYRFFKDKEELLAKTFDFLDDELVAKGMQHLPVVYMQNLDYETRCRMFFMSMWKFLLGNKNRCLAYIRYYYSPLFHKFSIEKHEKRYLPFLQKFKVAFKPEANVWMLLKHILNVMFDFAIKVFEGEISDSDDTAEHIFRLAYFSVKPYFIDKKENS